MDFEIAIEGPSSELSDLFSRLLNARENMKEVHTQGFDKERNGRIMVIVEGEERLESTLRSLSGLIATAEKSPSANSLFDIRVRNLSYSEPASGSSQFKEAFNPIPSVLIQPWFPSLDCMGDENRIVLDTNNAFGTGKHPTTRLCLQIVERILKDRDESCSVLDFGCGTGILSIASIVMGAERCTGVEIDPQAVKVAKRNVELNSLGQKIEIRQGSWEAVHEKFDLVIANVVAVALFRSGTHIPLHMKDSGRAVISGFSMNQAPEMNRYFKHAGLKREFSYFMEGWAAMVLRKTKAGIPGAR